MTDYTFVKTEKIGHIFRMILNRPSASTRRARRSAGTAAVPGTRR